MAKKKTELKREIDVAVDKMTQGLANGDYDIDTEAGANRYRRDQATLADLKKQYREAEGDRGKAEIREVAGLIKEFKRNQASGTGGALIYGDTTAYKEAFADEYRTATRTGMSNRAAHDGEHGLYRTLHKEKWGSAPFTTTWEAKHSTCILLQMLVMKIKPI